MDEIISKGSPRIALDYQVNKILELGHVKRRKNKRADEIIAR